MQFGKTCTREFFKNVQNCNLSVFEKLTNAYFPQIAREIKLLLVNGIKGNVREKHTVVVHRDRSHALRLNFRDNSTFIFSMYKSKVDGTR